MPPTVLHVIPHTHWDREWYEPFSVMRYRLVKAMDRMLEALDDPDFVHFMLDGQTAAIEDYLEIRPGATDDVAAAVRAGRLAIGPWRIIPDQFLCSPETLVRNLQQGAAAAERLGARMGVGYLPDPFGHVGQMPQLLRLAGLTDAALWRGVPRAIDTMAFRWEAPDRSSVRVAYLPFGYGHAAGLPPEPDAAAARAERIAADLAPFSPGAALPAPNGNDHAEPQADLPAILAAANAAQDRFVLRHSTLPGYVATLPDAGSLPAWRGELRSSARANLLAGVLTARLPLKRSEFEATAVLERDAEPLAVLAGIDPGGLLARAWRGVVENSAHDSVTGCGIDEVARDVEARYDEAIRLGGLIAADAATALAERVDTSGLGADEEGFVAFNPSPRARGGVAEVTLAADPDAISFVDPDGRAAAAQPIAVREQVALDMVLRGGQLEGLVPMVATRRLADLYVNGLDVEEGRPTTIRLRMGMAPEGDFDVEGAKQRVLELARRSPRGRFHVRGDGPPLATMLVAVPEVPGLGWSVLRPVRGASAGEGVRAEATALDNGIVRAEIAADGTVSVRAGNVSFAGLLGITDGGDAGDEYNYAPPEHDLVMDVPDGDVVVDELRSGPVDAALVVRRLFRVPAALSTDGRRRARRRMRMAVHTTLALRAGEPFVRATVRLVNAAADHRVRAQFPLGFTATGSAADGAFEVVERPLVGEGGPNEAATGAFPSRRWVDVSDGARGLAVFHRGAPEYEVVGDGAALAVTLLRAVGYLSRHGLSTRAGPAGPVLPTPGAQVPGEHVIELALFPHVGDWRAAGVHDVAERYTYALRTTGVRAHPGHLPARAPALEIEPPSVQLSALTDEGGTHVRVVNTSPEPVEALLRCGPPLQGRAARRVDLLGATLDELTVRDGAIELPLRAWEIATVRLD